MFHSLLAVFSLFFFTHLYAGTYIKPVNVSKMLSQKINGDTFYYSNNRSGSVSYKINAPHEGYYRVRANVIAPDSHSNSFFVTVNDRFEADWHIRQNTKPQYATWDYNLYLYKGHNEITFRVREPKTKIAKLLLDYNGPVKMATQIDFADKELHLNYLGKLNPTNLLCDYGTRGSGCKWDRKELAKIKRDLLTGKPVLEVNYPPVSIGTPRVGFKKKFNPRSDEYTLSYRVKFGAHYRWAQGGKMHGLGPAKPTTGCQPRTDEGWSVRMLTASVGRLALYIYDQDRKNPNGCGEGFIAPNFKIMDTEKWYDISIYVKLNSPNQYDGAAKLFVDGKQIQEVTDLRLRKSGSDDSLFRNLIFSTFYGGGSWDAAPDRTTHVQFSDFQVSEGEVPRKLTDKVVAASFNASTIKKLLVEARSIPVPNTRDRGVKKDFGKYKDAARASFDLELGTFSHWRFSNEQRYNGYFIRDYAQLLLRMSHLYTETVGSMLPKLKLDFHSLDEGQIGYQLGSSPFRSFAYNQDPNQILKQFLIDLIYETEFSNPSQRNAVRSINVGRQSLASSFSQLAHRAFRFKNKNMFLPQLLRRSALLRLQEEQHYKQHPVGSRLDIAQTSIDLKVDNFGIFEYNAPYGRHVQSGVRSKANVERWHFPQSSTVNQSLARAYGEYLIELHDIFRTTSWKGDPTLNILVQSKEPTKQFRIGSKPVRKFKSGNHPRVVLESMYRDF